MLDVFGYEPETVNGDISNPESPFLHTPLHGTAFLCALTAQKWLATEISIQRNGFMADKLGNKRVLNASIQVICSVEPWKTNVRCRFHLERLVTFPKPLSPEDICLSQTAIYRTGQPRLFHSSPSWEAVILSLSILSTISRSLSPPQRTKLRQLAYKIADSIIQLHNQDKRDGDRKREMWRLMRETALATAAKLRCWGKQSQLWTWKVGKSKILMVRSSWDWSSVLNDWNEEWQLTQCQRFGGIKQIVHLECFPGFKCH